MVGIHISSVIRRRYWRGQAQAKTDTASQISIDNGETAKHAVNNCRDFDVTKLEREGINDVVLFDFAHAVPEQRCLSVRVVWPAIANFGTVYLARHVDVPAVLRSSEERTAAADTVRQVRRPTLVDCLLVHAVTMVVVDRRQRPVDGDLREVRAAEAGQLGVQVTEQPRLHEWVIGNFDTRHEMAGMKRHLFYLGEEICWAAVQGHPTNRLYRYKLLGDKLGRVQQIDAFEVLVVAVRHDLNTKLPLGEGA